MSYQKWAKNVLRKFDPTLFVLINEKTGYLEIWKRATVDYLVPRSRTELQMWLDTATFGYGKVMTLVGQHGEPADPGPYVIEVLIRYDTQRDPHCLERYWKEKSAEKVRREEKFKETLGEEIRYHARGMRRDLEGKEPHGGAISVPNQAPV